MIPRRPRITAWCAPLLALSGLLVLEAEPSRAQSASANPVQPPEAMGQASDANTLVVWGQGVQDHSEALSAIWPGYWPAGQPFILHQPGVGAVFGGAAAPGGLRFQADDLPGDDFAFQLHHPSGPPHTIAVRARDISDLQLMFHEQFHDFQTQTFGWSRGGTAEYVDLTLIPDLAAFVAATDLERRLLAQAILADDLTEKRRLVRLFNTLRLTRHNALDPSIGQSEDYHEWTEGTAEYAAIHAAAVLGEDTTPVRQKLVSLLETPALDRPGALVTSLFRWRSYGSGAAQAQLLSDLGATRWQQRVESGFSLAALLENAVGRASNAEAMAWIGANDLPGLASRAAEALSNHEPPITDASTFLAQAPARLVIELELSPQDAATMQLSFQSQGMTPLAEAALALPDATRFLARLERRFSLAIRDSAILYEPLAGPNMQRITVLLPDLSGLDTLDAGLPATLHDERMDLSVQDPTDISRSETEVRVRLTSR
jgi:hypothetical protein